jgi:hypothetical protein
VAGAADVACAKLSCHTRDDALEESTPYRRIVRRRSSGAHRAQEPRAHRPTRVQRRGAGRRCDGLLRAERGAIACPTMSEGVSNGHGVCDGLWRGRAALSKLGEGPKGVWRYRSRSGVRPAPPGRFARQGRHPRRCSQKAGAPPRGEPRLTPGGRTLRRTSVCARGPRSRKRQGQEGSQGQRERGDEGARELES